MEKPKLLNVPNVLSAYRIVALPFIIWAIYTQNKSLFTILLSINLISDILDGIIARAFHLETDFGAKLDSVADAGTFLAAIMGMILLEGKFALDHLPEFAIIFGLYLTVPLVSFLKFKQGPSLHLYSSKIVAYLQGIFLFTFFVFGYHPLYFYFMVTASCLSYLEEVLVLILLPVLRTNCKGIYWVLKGNKK